MTQLRPVAVTLRTPTHRRAFVILAIASLVYASLRMFSGFSFYDDEGSLMLMSRWLLDGHSVYGEFNSIYGPFYFLYVSIAHAFLGGSASHSATRLMAVVPWVITSIAAFGFTLRITGRAPRLWWLGSLFCAPWHFYPSSPAIRKRSACC